MVLTQCKASIACDTLNCKRLAAYSFEVKGKMKTLNLCENCLRALRENVSLLYVPKSPKNAILKAIDRQNTATFKEEK